MTLSMTLERIVAEFKLKQELQSLNKSVKAVLAALDRKPSQPPLRRI